MPMFSGDKKNYQGWNSAFLACIDNPQATSEYELLQLRQCLSGDALRAIENLGHSATAYAVAKEQLKRKFWGKRCQISNYFEDLEKFRQIQPGHTKDLEEFADLLEITIIKLKEADQHYELGNGSLYSRLQQKLPESMLARYHRWISNSRTNESVVAFNTWLFQESQFQTIVSEMVHSVTGVIENNEPTNSAHAWNSQQTFFGRMLDHSRTESKFCEIKSYPTDWWSRGSTLGTPWF